MRYSFTSLIAIILALIGIGCQPSSSKTQPQKLKINIVDEPQTLDPRKARDLKCQTIVRMLFDGLTRINPSEKIELALAEKVDISSDLKTYTFHLKKSSWSNGDPVTSRDFAYAWKKMLSTDFPSDTAFNLYVIKNAKAAKEGKIEINQVGIRTTDDHTLIVELENPTPYFLELTASPAFFPVNQKLDENNPSWAQSATTYVGNGPFQLLSWKNQNHLSVGKNPTYWDAESVHLESILLEILQPETELKLFEKEEISWAGSPLSTLPVDALKILKQKQQLKTKELLGTYFFRTNTERPPFNHPLIRKAFALAIDRKSIVDHVTQGNQIPATGLVPISLLLQNTPYFQDADTNAAKELFAKGLEALHLKAEEIPEISLMYRAGERSHLIAQAVQQQWFETFGIRIKLEAIEGKVYFDRISKQNYQLASCDWMADFADPINFLEVFKYKKGGSNNTLWENSEFTKLLDESAQIIDVAQRREILKKSEEILMNEMPIIPVFYYTMLYVNQPSLKDVVLSSMGQIDFKWARTEIVQGDLQ